MSLKKLKDTYKLRTLTDKNLKDFSSNDYLGLANIPQATPHPSGSTGSRLLTGNYLLAEQAEALLARSFGYPSCLLYSSGYLANLGVLSCLPGRGDTILYDQYAHACIKDGARLSHAVSRSFRHNDLSDLERQLRKAAGQVFIVVESVYSMDGDEAPLRELAALSRKYGAALIVDEAHATAVCGEHGGGLSEALGLQDELLAVIYTFGKGMGSHGAMVACREVVREYLINFSRPFMYTTALPPGVCQHLVDVHPLIRSYGERRESLRKNISLFIETWKSSGPATLELLPSRHAIQAVICPGNAEVRALAARVSDDGYDVRPILAPTVPEGRERIRICLHAFNSGEEITGLVRSFNKNSPS